MNSTTRIVHAIMICLIFFGLYECAVGILQIIGTVPSGNVRYPVTGTFFNPGPYCGFVAMLTPLAMQQTIKSKNKFIYFLSYIFIFAGLFILPISMGRTGWIAAIIGCLYVYIKESNIKIKKCHVIVGIIAIFAGGIALYLIKPASALGRVFLWKLGINAVIENPLFGVGWDNVSGAIGSAQESYFKSNSDSIFANVAGSPEYAFNEFLQIAIAFGIPALIAFILLFVLCFHAAKKNKEYGLAGTILAAAIVCMASYPLQFREFIATFTAIIIAAILLLRRPGILLKLAASSIVIVCCCFTVKQQTERQRLADDWKLQKLAYQYSLSEKDMCDLDSLHGKMRWSKDFLFDYGKALRNNHFYEKSNVIMQEGAKISSDAMFLNLIGRNYFDLKRYDIAAQYFERSINRLPNRLYPYYLLAKLYADSCSYNPEQFNRIYRAAMKLEPKVQSPATRQMRSELKSLKDSIESIR